MPELPEVETVRRRLGAHIEGHLITSVEGEGGRLVRNNPQGIADLHVHLPGAEISRVERRGKFMWLCLRERDLALVIHLGMSGQVRVAKTSRGQLARHEHLRLIFDDGRRVSFVDPRTFGHVTLSGLITDANGRLIPELARKIAPDPFEDISLDPTIQKIRRSRRPIKTVLLDQAVISGIGNIYADEALFLSGIHGTRGGDSLEEDTLKEIVENARVVMGRALAMKGTSFDSAYVTADGEPGEYGRALRVYRRSGRACPECGDRIQRMVIHQRSHFFCPTCQPCP